MSVATSEVPRQANGVTHRPTIEVGTVEASPQLNDLAAALAKAQGEVAGASKDKTNPHFKSSYADLASVWDACRAPLSKNGLAVVQQPVSDGAKVGVRTALLHASGQWMASTLWTVPRDQGPQAQGSCITYLRRYMLAAVVGVAPEDDDGEGAEGRQGSGPKGGKGAVPHDDRDDAEPVDPAYRAMVQDSPGAAPGNSRSQGLGAEPPPAETKPVTANKIPHEGKPATAAQVKMIHVLRGKFGGKYAGPDDDGRSAWRKAMGAYKDQQGNPIATSTDLSAGQASHLIDRMQAAVAKQEATHAKMEAEAPENVAALGGGQGDGDGVQVKIDLYDKLNLTFPEADDEAKWLQSVFGVNNRHALTGQQKLTALGLVLAYANGEDAYAAALENARSKGPL